jgi:tRNA(fMet)-specific endonuclease VapC
MTGAFLDTNAVSDLMRDQSVIKARVAGHSGELVTSVVVRGEIRYGLDRLPAGKKRAALEARALAVFTRLPNESVTSAIADSYGRLKASMEAKGYSFGDNDLWIAATTAELGFVLVTRDAVFKHVPGLQVEDWTV